MTNSKAGVAEGMRPARTEGTGQSAANAAVDCNDLDSIVTVSDRVRMKEIGAQMAWGAQQCRPPRTLGEALGRMDEIARRLGVDRGAKDDGGVSAILAYLPIHRAARARLDREGTLGGG